MLKNKFTFKRQLPLWKTVLGLLVLGFVSLFSNYRGFLVIGIGIYMLLIEGSEFDFIDRKYRKQNRY